MMEIYVLEKIDLISQICTGDQVGLVENIFLDGELVSMKKQWGYFTMLGMFILVSCNRNEDGVLQPVEVTRVPAYTPSPDLRETAAAWTPTAKPSATTEPTPTTDPSVYEFTDPMEDCVDADDQPQLCLGNDIIRIQAHGDWPSASSLPESPPEGVSPIAWLEIELSPFDGLDARELLVCVSIDFDNDPNTGLKEEPLVGAEMLECMSPGMDEIYISEYGSDGQFVQDDFLPIDNRYFVSNEILFTAMCDGPCYYGDNPSYNFQMSASIQICSPEPFICDFVSDIPIQPAAYDEPAPPD